MESFEQMNSWTLAGRFLAWTYKWSESFDFCTALMKLWLLEASLCMASKLILDPLSHCWVRFLFIIGYLHSEDGKAKKCTGGLNDTGVITLWKLGDDFNHYFDPEKPLEKGPNGWVLPAPRLQQRRQWKSWKIHGVSRTGTAGIFFVSPAGRNRNQHHAFSFRPHMSNARAWKRINIMSLFMSFVRIESNGFWSLVIWGRDSYPRE